MLFDNTNGSACNINTFVKRCGIKFHVGQSNRKVPLILNHEGQSSGVRNILRKEAKRTKKNNFSASCNLIIQYNLLLSNVKTIIKKHLPVLHSNQEMLHFPENTVNITYRINKNLKEIILPSLFPRTVKENICSIEKYNRRCDICKNFFVLSTEFTCDATKRKYKIRGFLICNLSDIIYLIACKCCGKQYIGTATSFKEKF